MNYPVPNPRVLSRSDERPFEYYLELIGDPTLFEAFAFFLQKTTYEWVVDYARFHDNHLPPQETTIFDTTEELVKCLRFSKNLDKVQPEAFQKLIDILPQSSWFVHPTYPLSLSQLP